MIVWPSRIHRPDRGQTWPDRPGSRLSRPGAYSRAAVVTAWRATAAGSAFRGAWLACSRCRRRQPDQLAGDFELAVFRGQSLKFQAEKLAGLGGQLAAQVAPSRADPAAGGPPGGRQGLLDRRLEQAADGPAGVRRGEAAYRAAHRLKHVTQELLELMVVADLEQLAGELHFLCRGERALELC